MKMTESQIVAKGIRAARTLPGELTSEEMRAYIARRIAMDLAGAVPFFDTRGFLDACGVDGVE